MTSEGGSLLGRQWLGERRPDPHPLDFDWRFTKKTRHDIASFIDKGKHSILLGTPSLFNTLPGSTLIDRQPVDLYLDGDVFGRIDLRYQLLSGVISAGSYDVAVVDAPWYPNDLRVWLQQAMRSVHQDSTVYFTLWPDTTRPSAALESEEIRGWLRRFGHLEILSNDVEYETPHFELNAGIARGAGISGSWRRGSLVRLSLGGSSAATRVKATQIKLMRPSGNVWQRFVFDHTQLAVKIVPFLERAPFKIEPVGSDWIFDTVSRRDLRRAAINIWSSDGYAATSSMPNLLAEALQQRSAWKSPSFFEIAAVQSLLAHGVIPFVEPERRHQWIHFE